jgi:DNA-binding CsgD family transcriptional regulator/tetratricopeptide (TPR) repeat protein
MSAPTTSLGQAGELLERAESLALLEEALAGVSATGNGTVILVGGEAGVGKTVLLRRFCQGLDGMTNVLWGACVPLFTPRPLGPFLEIADAAGGELARAIGDASKPYEVAGELMLEAGRHAPTVLVLDDVHWADEATLDVLRLMARRAESVPVLILASYRDDELEQAHPLRIVIGELATSPAAQRIGLHPLSRGAVTALAEARDVDPVELYERTGGNPFFVTGDGESTPPTVRDAVLARAARLEPEARTVLEAVAVAPPHAELWLVEALAGEDVEHLDQCLSSGMLKTDAGSVAFRHELARLAFEEALPPARRVDLHRRALAALSDPPNARLDLERLAHHAESAGDVDAVLRFAPEAAATAASVGAHREAAALYGLALRYGERLPIAERADLLERRSHSCTLTDDYEEAIAAIEEELELRRELGDKRKEGGALQRLSQFLWCPGRTVEAERYARDAVALLEQLPPSHELGWAYWNLGSVCASATLTDEAVAWSERACALAERLGDDELGTAALGTIGGCRDYELLQKCLDDAQRAGRTEQIGGLHLSLADIAVTDHRNDDASHYLDAGIAFASERGFEVFRLYLLASRARFELDQGRWSEAAEAAESVLRTPRTSTSPRIVALSVLGLVRARRGDPEVWPLLDEAWTLAEPTGELPRLGPIATARAEAAWLSGRSETVAGEVDGVLELAFRRGAGWVAGPLSVWRRRAGVRQQLEAEVLEPYALELAGDAEGAALAWVGLGCRYEAALSLAHADETEARRRALAELQSLGGKPAAAIVARGLREQGARGLPRGPRATTRRNVAGLTTRELEVLGLLASGLRNADIAERLVLSRKTVDHHVSAILRKLEVRTRGQAVAEAAKRGLLLQR